MFANKFFLLFINFLWMGGLFGVLFALLYMAQYGRRHFWSRGYQAQTPRSLIPLYGALGLFGSGLALYTYAKFVALGQVVGVSLTTIWVVLALFFFYHWIELLIDGFQIGWDSPLSDPDEEGGPSGITLGSLLVIVLLVSNLGVLTWWGAGQVQAGALDLNQLISLRGQTTQATTSVRQPVSPAKPGTLSPALVATIAQSAHTGAPSTTAPVTGTVVSWLTTAATAVNSTITAGGATISQVTTSFWAAWFGENSTAVAVSPTIVLTPFITDTAILTSTATITATWPTGNTAVEPTATTTSTATATSSPTATATITETPTPTATPTMTASPTLTPTLTATPTPTPTATPTAPPRPTATAAPPPTPTLTLGEISPLVPVDQAASSRDMRFEWSANFTPSPDYAFEVIFWRPDQQPLKQGLGMAAPTLGNSVNVDLQALDERLGDKFEPTTYQWGVLLVRTRPAYARIGYLGGGWHFTYYR